MSFLKIGMQQGLQPGFTSSWPGNPPAPAGRPLYNLAWGLGANTDPAGGINGVIIPNGERIASVWGSMTIKQPIGMEILFRLSCGMGDGINYVSPWTSEWLNESTILPPLPLWLADEPDLQSEIGVTWERGIWIEWQAINNTAAYTGDGNAFEIQLTILTKKIGTRLSAFPIS